MTSKYKKYRSNKNTVTITTIAILLIIIVGFIVVEVNMMRFYNESAKEQAQNDVILTGIDVSSQITNVSTGQRVASVMIANDIFLQDWAQNEEAYLEDSNDSSLETLYDYLKTYQKVLDYDTVFFVSETTGNYYYQDGFNKTISPTDDFDVWYYNFLDLEKEYDIQIDRDETLDYSVSLFVNCRVEDSEGNLIGVAGTAQQINDINSNISTYESTLGVNVYVINTGNAVNSFSGSDKYYKAVEEVSEILGISEDTLLATGNTAYEYTWLDSTHCMTCQYNSEMGWNIIVVKDISNIQREYRKQMLYGAAFLFIVLTVFVTGSSALLSRMNKLSREAENTDDLTGLCNNRLFREKYHEELKKRHSHDMTLFMVDIDDFKMFNDTYGHLYGNAVIKLVASELDSAFNDIGIVGRWGGDEFIGITVVNNTECTDIFYTIQESIKAKSTKNISVSISVGITTIKSHESVDSAIKRADIGLYESKKDGKGKIVTIKN